MREALLYEKLSGSRVKCNVCQWRCEISPGNYGVCRMRQNLEGVLYSLNYALVSSAAVDPIEKKPLFHFYPGTSVYSLGTWGCNFHCTGCQNWQIACTDVSSLEGSRTITPEQAVDAALRSGSAGIAWTYNEPAVWFEYTLDSARLAKKKGLYTIYVTNGYMTEEALDMIGPYLGAYRVDIKGFSDRLYKELARVTQWRGILDVAKRARDKWNMHVEVVTNITPAMNDDDEQLEGIARWIKDNLGELTPWHITRFYPQHKMEHIAPTSMSSLEHAYDIGIKAGLRFIYMGNVPGNPHENTECYSCGSLLISRIGYNTKIISLDKSRCRKCGAEVNVRVGEVCDV
ncbi:MAG: AmmeMemoRadiSam system radical SAM enzyme [Dehalococcoidia bacterium]